MREYSLYWRKLADNRYEATSPAFEDLKVEGSTSAEVVEKGMKELNKRVGGGHKLRIAQHPLHGGIVVHKGDGK